MKLNSQTLLLKAKKLVKKGEIKDARQIYLSILEVFPKNVQAQNSLKELDNKVNKVKHKSLSRAQLDSVINLINSGQIKQAIGLLNPLMQKYPNAPILYNLSGICFNSVSNFDDAIKMFAEAIKIKPDYAEAFYNHASAQKKIGRFQGAIESYKKAIQITPNYLDAYNNLGNIYKDLGYLDDAVDCYKWAIAYGPEYAIAHINLASLYSSFDSRKALHHYQKAISINPDYPEAHFSLGTVLSSLGQKNESIVSYEKALKLRPDYTEAHNALSTVKTYKKNDAQALKMENLLKKNDLNLSERISLNFGLAKVNEDLDNSKKFFKYLNEGNKLNKEKSNFSLSDDIEGISKIREVFQSFDLNALKQPLKKGNPRPIFIVGMPRSGTSLVEQILSSHNEVFGAGELDFLSKSILRGIHKEFYGDKEFDFLSKNILRDINAINISQITSSNFFAEISSKYYKSLSSFNFSENVFTDKMPLNFRFIGFVLAAFPDAKIVHLNRNPMATCWSIYKHFFKSNGNGYASNFDDLSSYYLMYQDLMEFWHKAFPNKIYDLSYEDLTLSQEIESRKLIDYCNLNWDDSCLNFHENTRAVHTTSGLQVREKMYQGSSEAWRKYEQYLEPLISKIGDAK
jgi:tetratricopeptide (TPR) repeat protein